VTAVLVTAAYAMVVGLVYAAALFTVDACLTLWHRRQEMKRQKPDKLGRISSDNAVAVERIGAAFVLAHWMIRTEAGAHRGDRR